MGWLKNIGKALVLVCSTFSLAEPIAVVINVCDPHSTTEIRWNDWDPVIFLHDSKILTYGVQGRTFGHVVALDCHPACGYLERHEMAHVKQHSLLGDAYILDHLLCEAFSYLATGSEIKWNPLEWGPYQNNPTPWGVADEFLGEE